MLSEGPGLHGGDEHEQSLRCRLAHALQERRKIWIAKRHADGFGNLAAPGLVVVGEGFLGLEARGKFGDQRDGLGKPAFDRPIRDDR